MENTINIKVRVSRQAGSRAKGGCDTYELNRVSVDSSCLDMLDV